MGWWRNAQGDQLGDEPADAVRHHLEQLVQLAGERPTLEQLLLGLKLVLADKTNDLCAPGEDRRFTELVADVETPSERVVTIHAQGNSDPRIRDALDVLCEAISDAYAMALERRPTRNELLRTFTFVLGYAPDDFLDIEVGSSVRSIRET
jgi:hypothetical protein